MGQISDISQTINFEQSVQERLLDEVLHRRREQSRILEGIERIKFKQDVRTGLTYFDKVKEMSLKAEREMEELRERYERNIIRLINIQQI